MLIPLGTEQAARRSPVLTGVLLALTVTAHLFMATLTHADPDLHARILGLFKLGVGTDFRWWGLFTCTLLHANWIHLAGNMFFFWTFAPAIEDRFGRLGFLVFYLAGAAASSGAHAALESVPAIGASGAIAAVTGAYLVLFPFTRVRCLWLFGATIIHPPAWWLISLGIAWNIIARGLGAEQGVAHVAHLAGYAFGIAVPMILLWANVFPRQPYDLFTFFRQARRRRELRAATSGQNAITRPERAAARPNDHTLDAISAARARVSTFISQRRLPEAADAYLDFCNAFAHRPELLTLARNAQYEIATWFYRESRYSDAAVAFSRFLDVYPNDREADPIRMLLARTYLTRLDRPADAQPLLVRLSEQSSDEGLRALARDELAHLQRTQE
ncbi:MAG: rhomboid family intramembrane serine protease [Phycisphaerales bacterium]|nr:rhomboid family intramembrane serine protease [Phycisphaerales bacterium]